MPAGLALVRKMMRIWGYKKDFDNLVTAARCLSIYAYDLRDGYHSNNTQPYASRKTGYNIQLDKLINIHKLKSSKDLYPDFQRACTASDELLEAIGINKKKK